MKYPAVIDLHMHTTASDGTDEPEMIIDKVAAAGIGLFAVTDHDTTEGSARIKELLSARSAETRPLFLEGIEFSCRDKLGKYHILGYGYNENQPSIREVVEKAHTLRIRKVYGRLEFLEEEFGFTFSQPDIDALFKNSNPGKPHIAKMMIRYGYAKDIKDAISNYLNKKKFPDNYIPPEEAISAVLKSGGVPVLAHPSFGDGDQLIVGDEMKARIERMTEFGLQGVEGYYSGFTPKLTREILGFAEQYDLFVTAGSDYHGENKIVRLADTNLDDTADANEHLLAFLERIEDSLV